MSPRESKKATGTGQALVIVESPAKARTLERILGPGYVIKASMGHVRDLPTWKLGVDVANGFAPQYEVVKDKKKVVEELKKLAGKAPQIYLATDPDREGEAISWHLVETAEMESGRLHRVEFHEITPEAVTAAFKEPRDIDMDLVQAQQARCILDRLVGYKVSPILGKKVQRGLSAGRVQSVALRLIVDRERQVQGFVPQEYWSIEAELTLEGKKKEAKDAFRAALVGVADERQKLEIANSEAANGLVAELEKASYAVSKVQVRESPRNPAAPFTTSTLQQEGWRKLRFTAKRTMALAQQLYEGISVGAEGSVGLITYMRTDSIRVAAPAIHEARDFIKERFGENYLPKAPRVHAGKQKGAQEAHEAIRPTSARRHPDALKQYLSADQLKLYELIWNRMVASQMAAASIRSTQVDVAAKCPKRTMLLRASASEVVFPGFLVLYEEGRDEEEAKANRLPSLTQGQALDLLGLYPEQHFTQPPPRYTEATLIKALEENGIGRPSTYASILSILGERQYANRDRGRFVPTEMGMTVCDLLIKHFADVVDIKFTAQMEDNLDEVARGEREWHAMLGEFYGPFSETVKKAAENMESLKPPPEPTDEVCEKCGQPMVIRSGRFGRFLSCSGFPKCKNAGPLPSDQAPKEETPEAEVSSEVCEKCGKPMVVRQGRFGKFLSCTGYPECKTTKRLPSDKSEKKEAKEVELSSEKCDKCGKPMVVKEGRSGKFLACTGYPKCKNAKSIPTGAHCPECQGDLVERRFKGRVFYGCANYPTCRYTTRELPQVEVGAESG